MAQSGTSGGRASARACREEVETEAALDLAAEQFERAPGAGAEVERRNGWPVSAARIAASTSSSAT
jgi:hypothetical protein